MRFEENTFFFYELSFDHESVIYEQYLFLSLPLLPMIFFFFLHGNVFFLQVPSSQSPSTPGEQAPRSADPSFVSTQGESFIFKVLLSPPLTKNIETIILFFYFFIYTYLLRIESNLKYPGPAVSTGGLTAVVILVSLVLLTFGWIGYAYFYPHTWSGQILIKV